MGFGLYGSLKYSDIVKKLRDAQYEDERQLNVVDTNMTLDEWYAVWMETCKKNCHDTTKRTYEIRYNRLREELGWRKLSKLNLVIIQQAFNGLKSDASREDCKALLIDMLNRAMETDMLNRNPALKVNVKIDNEETEEKRVLTGDEIQILFMWKRHCAIFRTTETQFMSFTRRKAEPEREIFQCQYR